MTLDIEGLGTQSHEIRGVMIYTSKCDNGETRQRIKMNAIEVNLIAN